MRKLRVCFCLLIIVVTCHPACRPLRQYTISNAHSHNDYLNTTPFYAAYDEGFGSIEADVFPLNGVLYVAHNKEAIQAQHTLQALYLQPLRSRLKADSTRKLNLLVDIKENETVALSLLVQELQPLMPYLSTASKPGNLTISISGERPPPEAYANYPDFIFFDDNLVRKHSTEQWQRVHLVSLSFADLSSWTGKGALPARDRKILKHIIDSVHTAGKPIRFWAAPDTRKAWKAQMKLGVDLIGTDTISGLGDYLRKSQH